jgi:hypothetical protein
MLTAALLLTGSGHAARETHKAMLPAPLLVPSLVHSSSTALGTEVQSGGALLPPPPAALNWGMTVMNTKTSSSSRISRGVHGHLHAPPRSQLVALLAVVTMAVTACRVTAAVRVRVDAGVAVTLSGVSQKLNSQMMGQGFAGARVAPDRGLVSLQRGSSSSSSKRQGNQRTPATAPAAGVRLLLASCCAAVASGILHCSKCHIHVVRR